MTAFAEVMFSWYIIYLLCWNARDTILKLCACNKTALFFLWPFLHIGNFLSFWSERWSWSQDSHRGSAEKHAKVFCLIVVNFYTSKLWTWKQAFSWVQEIIKSVSLGIGVFWLCSSLCSNAQILAQALPNVGECNGAHSNAAALEKQLFLNLTEVL